MRVIKVILAYFFIDAFVLRQASNRFQALSKGMSIPLHWQIAYVRCICQFGKSPKIHFPEVVSPSLVYHPENVRELGLQKKIIK